MKEGKIMNISKRLDNFISAFCFAFKGSELLVKKENNSVIIPTGEELLSFNIKPIREQDLGVKDNKHYYSAELSIDEEAPEGMTFVGLRQLFGVVDEEFFVHAGRAIQIVNWDKTHQFCGQCGTITNTAPNEYAKVCPSCGLINYPRISPAIIVAIVKDKEILLARNAKSPYGFHSVLAGFVEPGETLEQCVSREVYEEVGLKVKNIKYFGSQPWPFPNSLMVGFTAEYESGEINVDKNEIAEAYWFKVDNMPQIPSSISIARKLIDWYVDNNK